MLVAASLPASAFPGGPSPLQVPGETRVATGVVEASWAWEPAGLVPPPAYIEPPEVLSQVMPAYTTGATRSGVQGLVIIEATIDAQGRVAAARLIRSLSDDTLNQGALEALDAWRFRPARLGGAPSAVTGIFTFSFAIRASDPAPATGLRAEAVEMGAEGLIPPRVLSREMPEYTTAARQAGIEGDVYIEAVVTARGEVAEPVLIRGIGDDELNQRALTALSSWRFSPGTVDGEPVHVLALFTVTFRIDPSR
jgi:TonB family protein